MHESPHPHLNPPPSRGRRRSSCLQIVTRLPMLREVESRHLVLVRDAKAHDRIDDLEDHERGHDRQGPSGADRDDLVRHLAEAAAEEEAVRPRVVDRFGGKEPGRDGAPGPADAVDSEDVERVVVPNAALIFVTPM